MSTDATSAGTKVFVGNLAFQTTDQALASAFEDCGQVQSGVVITRGRRSLGYGFVEFSSKEEAETAVSTKNGSQLSGRQIKVEHVREAGDLPPPRPKRASKPEPIAPAPDSVAPRLPGGVGGNSQQGQQRRRGPNNRRRNPNINTTYTEPRRTNPNRLPVEPDASAQLNNNVESTSAAPRRNNNPYRRANPRRGGRGRRPNFDDTAPPPGLYEQPQQQQQPAKDKILSKTAVFVSNIPFSVTDEKLALLFADYNVKTAHVVTTRLGRSRGYGFVEFETQEDQQAAIDSMNGHSVESGQDQQGVTKTPRAISVSVSHSAPKDPASATDADQLDH